jgi:hypothetical protein
MKGRSDPGMSMRSFQQRSPAACGRLKQDGIEKVLHGVTDMVQVRAI